MSAERISDGAPPVRYFELEARRDIEGIVALFAEDATVIDEGITSHGSATSRSPASE
jgi:hypothetical protein